MAEDELRPTIHTLAIVLNCRKGKYPWEDKTLNSKLINVKPGIDGEIKPSEEELRSTEIQLKTNREDDNKNKFIQRIKYSQEYLDLGDVEAGMNQKLMQENQDHHYIIVRAFDIVQDKLEREKFFEDILRDCSI